MANGKVQRDRGSIVDTITLEVFRFQWEPTHEETVSTKYGSMSVIGKRLPVKHWVGQGSNSIKINIILTAPAYTNVDQVSPNEVGMLRYKQLAAANKPGGTAADSVADAQARIRSARKAENKSVLKQIEALRKFTEPQEDIMAPHPVFLHMGGAYTGRKFVLEDMRIASQVTNYETMEPTEATVELVLSEVTDYRKK